MNGIKTVFASVAIAMTATGMASAATVDTVQTPTDFFVPTDAQKYDSPYYRGAAEDWGWVHGAIASGFSSVKLLISAFDVDYDSGELDAIYAYDDGVQTLLGYLGGGSDIWAFTEFTLGANFFNDVEDGLQVFMDIDQANQGWYVTLAKSVITTDGAAPPPPVPGIVPLPAAGWLMFAGIGGLAALRRRRRAA